MTNTKTEVSDVAGERVNKNEFLSKLAERTGLPVRTVSLVYKEAVAELMDIVLRGDRLMLTGLGSFYRQKHKGHYVQFANDGQGKKIKDYMVLKFASTVDIEQAMQKYKAAERACKKREARAREKQARAAKQAEDEQAAS